MIWTQWSDLQVPASLSVCRTDGITPALEDLPKITFYVPRYMSGAAGLSPIPAMTSLKIIQSLNAGVDDVLQVLPAGVTLCNAAGVHDASTAELAVGLAIAARRGFKDFILSQENGQWIHGRNQALTDSKVAIIGSGNIGRKIAELLQGFNVEISTFNRSGHDGCQPISLLDQLLPDFDLVILIVPLSDQTRGMFNLARLQKMKKGATLVNVARGPVVDTGALLQVLEAGHISAALDVTDPEPLPPEHPLWRAPNCIITPHVGGDSEAFVPRGRALIEAQLARYAAGELLENMIVAGAL